ncbi:MAG: DUF4139 domain-containing protein [Candidatus Hydrogenedentes bacterium]|nr:DUF4139 domain-containing protein [Candidatus Hydrogenedentota bacterium]
MKVYIKQLGLGILLGAFAATAELQNVQVGGSVDIRNRMRMPATPEGVSSQRDRTDISVTVYNNDLALVRDSRRIRVDAGEHTVRFSDVAAQIKPQTVKFNANQLAVRVLEQNYEYDLITPSKLMEKNVGKTVKIQDFNSHSSAGTVEAELLSVNEGSVYKVGNEIFIGRPGHVALPELPQELAARPTLQWLLESSQSLEADFEVSYLTGGISWNADYVVTLAKDEKSLDVEGWVTLANHCGATFENAQLKLVAGEVNRVREEVPRRMLDNGAVYDAPALMREEAFGEYHLYTLPRRTTIKQNQSKQVSLLSAANVTASKRYEYRGNAYFYSQQIAPIRDQKVGVFLVFDNKKENNLGMPLPAGVMRVYQEDQSGALQFAGEDRIKHTPKDEEVKLRLGNAFDVVAERTQTDFRVVTDQVFESAYEIKIRNHKEFDVVVDVVEELDNDWTILTKSHEFVKKDARTAVFSLPVPKDGETVLTYSVRLSHGVPRPLPLAAPTAAPRPRAIKAVPPQAVSVPAIAPDAR